MDIKMDPMGRAITDYHKTGTADRLRVLSPMFEEDEIPLQTLFRKYEEMPIIERKALDLAKGKILDVGAGAGCHSLVLRLSFACPSGKRYLCDCYRHLSIVC